MHFLNTEINESLEQFNCDILSVALFLLMETAYFLKRKIWPQRVKHKQFPELLGKF